MTIRTRIAPSPTGIAHLGTAYQAQRDYAYAKHMGGKFIVRIEDTDRGRYVEGAVDILFEAFKWLGYTNDEGPNVGGPYAPYTQSERLPIYQKYAKELVEKGEAYYCFCTKERLEKLREEQQARKELPRYDKHCRNLSRDEVATHLAAGEQSVIRMAMPLEGETVFNDIIRGEISFQNSGVDDQVLLKSDGFPTYHLAVVVDDYLMKITHIIRGEEWISSTPKHVQLYKAFGWELPVFAHLPLIRNTDHSKMSKRHNDVSVLSYRDKGYLPETMNNFLALLGWSHPEKKEIFSMEEYIKHFTLERVTTTAPVFDVEKLKWMNGMYIRDISNDELVKRLTPFIPKDCLTEMVAPILPLIKERLVTLADFESLTDFFYRDITVDPALLTKKSTPEEVKTQLEETIQAVKTIEEKDWTNEKIEEKGRTISIEKNWKPSQYFMMLRVAVTGRAVTPPLFETIEVLGRDKTLARLTQAIR